MAEQTGDRSDRPASNTKPPGGDLVLQWVLASVAGWIVGWIVAWVGALTVGWIVAWAGVGIGTGVGVAQWLVLKERVARAGWWLVASAVGGVVGGVTSVGLILGAYMGAGQIMGDVVAVILGWVLVGVGIGVAQWVVLRGHVARAGWWVLASVMGWIVGRIAAWFGVGLVAVDVIVGQLMGQVAYSVVYGLITGIVLVQLLRQRKGEADDAGAASEG